MYRMTIQRVDQAAKIASRSSLEVADRQELIRKMGMALEVLGLEDDRALEDVLEEIETADRGIYGIRPIAGPGFLSFEEVN